MYSDFFHSESSIYELYEKCKELNVKQFSYKHVQRSSGNDFDNEIDPDGHYYNKIDFECQYYSDFEFNNSNFNKDNFSVIHFNARSLKKSFTKIEDYLLDLNCSFDVIMISETWFDVNVDIDSFKLTGYTCFYTNRQIKKGGGVAIFVKSLFNAKKVDKCSISINDMYECLTVELIFENCKNTCLTCVYRTPGSSIELFIENFSLILNNMNMNKNVYICGDFNIDLLKFEVNNETKVFIDTMYSMGLFPLITRPSRLTEFTSTLIDNIFSNIVNFRHYSGLFVTDITDHLPVFVISNINGVKTLNLKKKYKVIRKISSESLDKFKEDLSKESWASVYSANSVDLAYDTFINIFIGLYDKHCRTKRICINGNSDNKPWFTKGLKNACIKKNLLYRKFLKTRLNIDNNKYKTYKNKLTTVLRACEKNYYNIQLKINKSNIKNTWKLINNVLNKSKFSEDCEHFKINNNEYTSDTSDSIL